jgi:3',5'-cyclic AMP phosphodiesterase CpdA
MRWRSAPALLILPWFAFALAASGPARPAAEPSAHFYFVQMSDTHFGTGDHAARTRRVVAAINNLPFAIECVVHTGDITSDDIGDPRTLGVATSVLSGIRVPAHYLPGNHDIRRRALKATLGVYTNAFGPLCSRAEHGGVVFLFLWDEPLRRGFAAEGYDPLAWLESELRAAGGRPAIVLLHSPPVEDFYGDRIRPGWPPENRARFTRIVNAANVKAVIAGHFHRDELHWLGRVPLYVCSAVAGYWGRQGSFRIYEYSDGRLGYRTVYLEPLAKTKGDSATGGNDEEARGTAK